MKTKDLKKRYLVWVFCLFGISNISADWIISVTGVDVPELAAIDDAVKSQMAGFGLTAGVVGISYQERIVYLRGFGHDTHTSKPIPENTPMRLASIEKVFTDAVIQDLINDPSIALNDTDYVFDYGQPSGRWGILPSIVYMPYNTKMGDARYPDIRLRHLRDHLGGWDIELLAMQNDIRDPREGTVFDPTTECILIAEKMGIDSPPGRINTVRYMLSQPLQFTPGDASYAGFKYSNYGYMLLGLIIEQLTGQRIAQNVHSRILTPDMWVPVTELFTGKTFYEDTDPREPFYISNEQKQNVFDPYIGLHIPNLVDFAYGGWDHEATQGCGNMVASAVPLLKFLYTHSVTFYGGAPGTATMASHYNPDMNVVILLNERIPGALESIRDHIFQIVDDPLNPISWPTFEVDGFWLDFNAPVSGYGGFNDPFHTMDHALAATTHNTKLRIKPGSSSWTGTISERMRLDAPFGVVTIGK